MELNSTLHYLLEGITQSLDEMGQSELKTFGENWQGLSKYLEQPNADYNEFLAQLTKIVNESPTLLNHAFGVFLTGIPRYAPAAISKPDPNFIKSLAPVRNEVIRIKKSIEQKIK